MKKVITMLFLGLIFCDTGFAKAYYLKECQIDENYYGNYLINLEENIIKRIFVNIKEETILEKTDKIQLITDDQIIVEKIKSGTDKNYYFQYYLDFKSNSVSIQKYKKNNEIDLFIPVGSKSQSFCGNVKVDWDKSKNENTEDKKQTEFEAEQARKRLKEKKKRQEELAQKKQEKKKKEENQHRISIDGEFFQAAKSEKKLESEKKLKKDFNKTASELCSLTGNFDTLEQNIKVIEVGETTAFPKKGLTAGIRLGISGVIKCR